MVERKRSPSVEERKEQEGIEGDRHIVFSELLEEGDQSQLLGRQAARGSHDDSKTLSILKRSMSAIALVPFL